MRINEEVSRALALGSPIVALESTVISHGLPYPENLHAAQRVEETIRANGAVPATIAVLAGQLCIGLQPEEIKHLATAQGIRKVSRRDLAIVTARGEDGATTVAATMWLAAQAGISLMATGGIGGVHRGQPFDISADLPELAQTPVSVVCAGAKAILDLPLTLEWLETHGIPVLGYGCDEFPAFYTRSSGLPVDARVDTPAQAAAVILARQKLGLPGGVLITVPVPPAQELPAPLMEMAIEQALAEAQAHGIHGKALTPFLLARVSDITEGASLRANLALLENNAVVAAQIAVELVCARRNHDL